MTAGSWIADQAGEPDVAPGGAGVDEAEVMADDAQPTHRSVAEPRTQARQDLMMSSTLRSAGAMELVDVDGKSVDFPALSKLAPRSRTGTFL